MIRFSIIICTYNRSDYLKKVLEGVRKQEFPKSDFELVLVNNSSPDDTDDVCRNFQNENTDLNITYTKEKKQGLSFARNTGLDLSKGEWVIFIDDDAEPVKDYLKNINEFLLKHKNCIAAGGRIYPTFETSEPKWMSKFLLPLVSAIDLGNTAKKFPANKYPIGANMIFKADVFKKIGYFNTDLGRKGDQLLGGEEKDIFMKLREISNNVFYIPNAVVYHFIPDKRLQLDFIKSMAIKIGEANLIIFKEKGLHKLMALELFKWGASLLLFLYYFLSFNYQKGIMILKFRYWVNKGILH
ncbi:MAG: hypothetical protein A2W99_15325 [Bacteroidetes bacterium GWF2_33_16]|nr:MAG: hypothetical protein A2X00_09535 [Bacteroidetes bacterium GWE2_32_14]OFY07691.1 MAG: hypothetical protein A2W99_15325 [Bacteroidetes bacterium GWF2_33_16]